MVAAPRSKLLCVPRFSGVRAFWYASVAAATTRSLPRFIEPESQLTTCVSIANGALLYEVESTHFPTSELIFCRGVDDGVAAAAAAVILIVMPETRRN